MNALPYELSCRESMLDGKRRIAQNELARRSSTIDTMILPSHALDSRMHTLRVIDHLLDSLHGKLSHARIIERVKGLDHRSAVKRGYTEEMIHIIECAIIHLEARRATVVLDPTLD
jgi:hypothetical protein